MPAKCYEEIRMTIIGCGTGLVPDADLHENTGQQLTGIDALAFGFLFQGQRFIFRYSLPTGIPETGIRTSGMCVMLFQGV